eukprot:8488894-Pyramimonas_sp.AAC.1
MALRQLGDASADDPAKLRFGSQPRDARKAQRDAKPVLQQQLPKISSPPRPRLLQHNGNPSIMPNDHF